ncbi:toxin-antitoxin system, antitoxin component, Xre domain protein [Clostridiales bacterium oral taxon 876 str. F0540]|nr:toxin-antitoxin system, antitoxin component, Xre domain protein [Clostridiales bacterium oral taxon 876 str. F0540]
MYKLFINKHTKFIKKKGELKVMKADRQLLLENLPLEKIDEIVNSYDLFATEKVISVLRLLNKEFNYSFKNLELLTTVNHSYLCKLANGERHDLSIIYFKKIVNGLNIEVEKFFYRLEKLLSPEKDNVK